MKTKFIIYIVVLSILICTGSIAGEDNYCLDKQSWQEWDNLSQKYLSDSDIRILYNLRLNLCTKIERGDITVQQATEIFEKARDAIINKEKIESQKEEKII